MDANVKALQQALADRGFDPGPVDGILGSLTKNAIRALQFEFGLVVDGDAGPKTLAKLSDWPFSPETLDSSADIILFGREVTDIAIADIASRSETESAAEPKRKLHESRRIVRVYGFTYDGAYFTMPGPVLFVVDGIGVKAALVAVPGPNPRNREFFDELRAWTVNKECEAIRLDLDSGKYQTVLLDTMGI